MKRRQQNKQKKDYTIKIASQNVWPWLGCCHCQCQPAWSLSLVPAALALGAASGGWSAWAPRCALLCGERPLKSCTQYNSTVPAATFCLPAITTRDERPWQSGTQYNFTAPEATFHLPALTTKHECLLKPCTQYSLTVPAGTFCLPFWQESINVHCKHTHRTTLLCLKHHFVWQHQQQNKHKSIIITFTQSLQTSQLCQKHYNKPTRSLHT